MKRMFALLILAGIPFFIAAQQKITRSIKDFGAKGNGRNDDQDAFVKAAEFFRKRKGHGKLIIPKGVYIVGRQKFTGNEADKKSIAYFGDYTLDLSNCEDLVIEGNPGAVLRHRDSMRIGAFSPVNGQPFKHNMKDIQLKPEYAQYQSSPGCMIFISNSSNIRISGLSLDGNMAKLKLGGHWGIGSNPYELIHYGIYVLDSHNIDLLNCSIDNFGTDGIYLSNIGQQLKTYKINIDKCKANYNGRNGLSWLGGEDIRVTNSDFSNSGQGIIHESPGAGIDIEVENFSFCRNGYFYNCTMKNNMGSAITSGSGKLSSKVRFKKCTAASPIYYAVFVDADSHIFEDCNLYGTVLVWYKGASEKDGVTFRRCIFDENYQGKKMYDGSYQLGAEATAVQVENCTFKSYTISNYYLACHTKDCSVTNTQKIKVSNCSFYNYSVGEFRLAKNIAGIASYTVFYNNKFYALPGISFQNGFNNNCNADAGENKFYAVPKK